MKDIFKKNQLMITALAIMLAIAGYLQFADSTVDRDKKEKESQTVDSGKIITDNYTAEIQKEDALDGILDLSEEDLRALSEKNGTTGEGMEIASLDSDVEIVLEDYLEEGMEVYSENTADDEAVNAVPGDGEIPGEAIFTSTAGIEILADAKLLKEQTRSKNKETLLAIIGNEFLSDDQKQKAVNSMVEMTEIAEKESAAEILLQAKGFSDAVVSISDSGVDVVVNAISLTDAQRAQIEDIVRRKTNAAPENIIISTVVKD